ncbi:glycoside hydrolase family 16 protein [Vibrio gangliei]|uniref:glycoside hydrolase family 16 protein n=1 Tax=Vibrio gangliei TaxID=2077090 RepID=UPI000D013F89|nr:family 16 glycosylhydrolase [Vibrio gangliei]
MKYWLLLCFAVFNVQAQEVNQDTLTENGEKNISSTPLYGAELYSLDTVHFGKFVIKMKMLSVPGSVSSFFTYDNQSWQGEGRPWREIDIEAIGIKPDVLQTNLITGELDKRIHSETKHTVENLTDYHTYTLEWTPDFISWKVDGREIHKELAENSQQVVDMRDTPQTYRMNVWISEAIGWVGKFDPVSLPAYQVVDWIEYYEYKDDGSYSLKWRDDFDRFDQKRWGKGDWGFPGNLVTFSPDNVIVNDGKLMLMLSTEAGSDKS